MLAPACIYFHRGKIMGIRYYPCRRNKQQQQHIFQAMDMDSNQCGIGNHISGAT